MDDDRATAAEAWAASARAYIAFQDAGDRNRTLLLDPVMLGLCAGVRGLDVLDLGCGEGRFCRMLAALGARTTGIDATPEMTRTAARRAGDGQAYLTGSAESLPFADAAFDLVVSYVTLVDIADYAAAIRESARVLRPGGHLVAANLGFVTASSGWERDAAGKRLYRPIDRYADEFTQTYEWLGMRIINWHRPLSAYMRAYLGAGLVLRDFLEPVPRDESLRDLEWAEDWFRIPEFTVMCWQKPAATCHC